MIKVSGIYTLNEAEIVVYEKVISFGVTKKLPVWVCLKVKLRDMG